MEYLLVIHHDEAKAAALNDGDTQTLLAAYKAFTQSLVDAGAMRGANALHPAAKAKCVRVRGGNTMTTDGPFAETKEQLGGYYLIDCDTIEEACAHAANIPSALFGTIEVRQILKF